MVIPADLPPLVAPVAWMLGTWRGWGTRAADGGDAPVVEEVRGDVVGDQMRLVTRVYEGTADGDVDPTWDAASGLSVIARGPLLVEETLYVSVAPSDAPCPLLASTTHARSRLRAPPRAATPAHGTG